MKQVLARTGNHFPTQATKGQRHPYQLFKTVTARRHYARAQGGKKSQLDDGYNGPRALFNLKIRV